MDVVKNLAEKVNDAGLNDSFIIFDNDSLYKDHLAFAPKGALVVESPENIGYWTAIQWVLDEHSKLLSKDYDFIYMVESDLVHSDLKVLNYCAAFLKENDDCVCVRTQEFKVKFKWRFNKALKYMPFRVKRSIIALKNLVTNEKAWFTPTKFKNIYKSNLHAKLPALNRMSSMRHCFEILRKKDSFQEWDFFQEMHKLHPNIGVLDGGIFHSLISGDEKNSLTGSYSDKQKLHETGYKQTRYAQILTPTPVIENIKVQK